MSKSVITRLFLGGLIAEIAGVIACAVAFLAAVAASAIVVNTGVDASVEITPFGWSMIAVGFAGAVAMLLGALAGLVAWIGAVVNTAQLDDKTWFVVLLVLGLLSFGFVAMIAYVIAGPDSTLAGRRPTVAAAA
jgi:hypothetical protein